MGSGFRLFKFSFVTGLLMLSACLPDPLPVGKIPQLEPKLVVSSQMIGDQSLAVFVTKTFGALEGSEDSDPEELLNQVAVNDALVIIDGGGFRDTLDLIESGLYGGINFPLVEGSTYRLIVESAELGIVTSEATVLVPVAFQSLNAVIFDNGFDTLVDVSCSFQDLPGKNYYMINTQVISEEAEPEDFLNPAIFTTLFEDEATTDGQTITKNFKVIMRRDFIPGDTVAFFLSNISKGYFDFMTLRQDNRFNFSDFLGEPVSYPSNVTGGYGYFNLHRPDIRIIELE